VTLDMRLAIVYVVRLAFMALAGWLVLAPQALPSAHAITRGGLAATLLVLSILIGEVEKLHTQFDALMGALRKATGRRPGEAASAVVESEAVPILIRALASREADTREKAYRNLVRLTGLTELPPERAAWERWWAGRSDPEDGASGA